MKPKLMTIAEVGAKSPADMAAVEATNNRRAVIELRRMLRLISAAPWAAPGMGPRIDDLLKATTPNKLRGRQ